VAWSRRVVSTLGFRADKLCRLPAPEGADPSPMDLRGARGAGPVLVFWPWTRLWRRALVAVAKFGGREDVDSPGVP
jgi:hypothetical protein